MAKAKKGLGQRFKTLMTKMMGQGMPMDETQDKAKMPKKASARRKRLR